MKKIIRGLVYRVGQAPVLTEVEDSLEGLQGVVGGYIEAVHISDSLALICNEEGKLIGLAPNRKLGRDTICGDFIVLASDDEGNFVSLSDDHVKFVQGMLP